MRRRFLLLLPAALTLGGCKTGSPGSTAPDASSSPSAAPAPAPVATEAAAAPRGPLPVREGGAIVRSPADDALYVADEDQGVVRRIPLPLDPGKPFATIATPGLPAQVLALRDRVLVTVRSEGGTPPSAPPTESAPAPGTRPASRVLAAPTGPGLLLVMRPDPAAGLVEVARVALPADAWGIAVTPDEKTALVSSAWTHQVSAVDLATAKKTWSIDVPREPRAIVVRPDGASAYVTHLVGGRITRLDDLGGQPTAHAVTLPPSPLRSPLGKTLDGTLAYAAALSPDGSRLFVPRHAVGALGEAAWFGAATVDVLLTADDTPLAPRREAGLPFVESEVAHAIEQASRETQRNVSRTVLLPFVQPRAIVYRKRTSTLLVASEGTNEVAVLDARAVDPTMFVRGRIRVGKDREELIPVAHAGGAPSGLALSADESMLWVFCRSTGDVVAVPLEPPPSAEGVPKPKADRVYLHLADDLLGEPDGRGRRMFYDATDRITSGGMGCAGCHPEGRDDGHVWHETLNQTRGAGEGTNFLGNEDQSPRESTKAVGYPRQTPMLAGRVAASGPYGWHAESRDLVDRLKAGFNLHRWGQPAHTEYGDTDLLGRAQHLTRFLRHGLVPPPRDARPLTAEEVRGKELFESSRTLCARCHVPATEYTDRVAYRFTPPAPPPPGFEDEADQRYKVPSLLFVGGTPPYYHDGRAATLEELIERNGDRMGHTGHLSREDRAALAAFLRTL